MSIITNNIQTVYYLTTITLYEVDNSSASSLALQLQDSLLEIISQTLQPSNLVGNSRFSEMSET